MATVEPDSHLTALYPMTYLHAGKTPRRCMMPQLTHRQDRPGLAVEYNPPASRRAIEVIE